MSTSNEAVQLKVSQLYQAISSGYDTSVVKMLLKRDIDINWIIPAQYSDASNKLDFECTMLHVAYAERNIDTFQVLLEHGADFTIQNQSGSSILHHIFWNLKKKYPDGWMLHLDDSFIAAILSAHVRFGNSRNPLDKNGFSHFHISCMTNHLDSAKLFLNNGSFINQSVNVDSSLKPGYSPLHFAAEFLNYETVELLTFNGANMHLKNADGLTPLYVLIKVRLKISYCKGAEQNGKTDSVLNRIELYERIINLLLMNDISSCDDADLHGLTNFHVACTLQNSSIAICLSDQVADINHAVSVDSPICPGYTGLHFAANCNLDMVKALVKEGADLRVEDKEGVTPLDICMRRFKLEDIRFIISSVPGWKNILFSNSKSKLVDCLLAMKNLVNLKKFLQKCGNVNVSISSDSPIWPDYTLLHLAVLFSERFEAERAPTALVKLCLDRGADIHAQDKRGWTPLHLAFRQDKSEIIDFLFKIHSDSSTKTVHLSDEDNLSYIHISCIKDLRYNDMPFFHRKLLLTKRKRDKIVNAVYKGRSLAKIKTGWTPLHVAVVYGYTVVTERLLDCGANPLRTDDQGFTVIHHLFGKTCWVRASLFEQLEECKAQSNGLTHLHVVSWWDNAGAVRQLLEKGSDIEATIEQSPGNEEFDRFVGCTPLHVAMMNQSTAAVKELLQWGADILAKKPDSTSALSQALTGENEKMLNFFVLMLWGDAESRESMERQLGLTMLHIACHTLDLKKVRVLLEKGADANATVRNDSNVWPGCTPLHVLMRVDTELDVEGRSRDILRKDAIFELLLTKGADVTAMDARQSSPLQMILQEFRLCDDPVLCDLLLKHHLDYKTNPTDNAGLSYFHLVCSTNNFEAIKRFLEQGSIDVNRPIGYFASVYAGCTPLHLAVRRDNIEERVVKLLLDHGANVSSQDRFGDTPLHDVIFFSERSERLSIMKALLGQTSGKLDVNARNIMGKTAMEKLLHNKVEVEELKLLLHHGGSINACNPTTHRGYIAIVLSSLYGDQRNTRKAILQVILESAGLSRLDEMGRSAIHNSVTAKGMEIVDHDLITFITELFKLGCDIDHRDNFGKTALHLAVQFRNERAVCSLLATGADINVVDSSGKSAFSYVFEPAIHGECTCGDLEERLLDVLAWHVTKLKYVGVEVGVLNNTLCNKRMPEFSVSNDFREEVRAIENMKVGRRELTVRSFFCETGAISIYPSITPLEREEIAAFFENMRNSLSFSKSRPILSLQFKKAENRLALVAPAADALRAQLKFPLPDLCVEVVLKYLSNSELNNLIAASNDDEGMRMIVDQ